LENPSPAKRGCILMKAASGITEIITLSMKTTGELPGEEGSSRSLILSLLVDHSLYFHPAQTAQLENKLPAYTVGSLTEKIKVETIMNLFEQIIFSDAPVERFKKFARAAENNVVKLYPSTKHMISRDYEKFVALPSLKHRCEA
jgi:hypothetical protein